MERNKVIMVNEHDEPLGEMNKLEAHQKGELHRAFSVFLFNEKGDMLLQQRALSKYHSGGLWTNACCSHPQWGEDTRTSAMERLYMEMGIRCSLNFVFSFYYKASVENGLTEHEMDHVFIGTTIETPKPNPDEVMDFCWLSIADLQTDVAQQPHRYTTWFKQLLPRVLAQVAVKK